MTYFGKCADFITNRDSNASSPVATPSILAPHLILYRLKRFSGTKPIKTTIPYR